jgi:hypothetical protein
MTQGFCVISIFSFFFIRIIILYIHLVSTLCYYISSYKKKEQLHKTKKRTLIHQVDCSLCPKTPNFRFEIQRLCVCVFVVCGLMSVISQQ